MQPAPAVQEHLVGACVRPPVPDRVPLTTHSHSPTAKQSQTQETSAGKSEGAGVAARGCPSSGLRRPTGRSYQTRRAGRLCSRRSCRASSCAGAPWCKAQLEKGIQGKGGRRPAWCAPRPSRGCHEEDAAGEDASRPEEGTHQEGLVWAIGGRSGTAALAGCWSCARACWATWCRCMSDTDVLLQGGCVSGSGASQCAGPCRAWTLCCGTGVIRMVAGSVPRIAVHSGGMGKRFKSAAERVMRLGSRARPATSGVGRLTGGNPEPSAATGGQEREPLAVSVCMCEPLAASGCTPPPSAQV